MDDIKSYFAAHGLPANSEKRKIFTGHLKR